MEHPSLEDLVAFANGGLDDPQLSRVAEHVEECDDCAARIEEVPTGNSMLNQLRADDRHAGAAVNETSDGPIPDSPGSQTDRSLHRFHEIDAACQEYRQGLKSGDGGRIEEALQRVDQGDRATLLRNLIHIDIQHRRSQGEEPDLEDYRQRFPNQNSLIGQALAESLAISRGSVETDDVDLTVDYRPPSVTMMGSYILERELGRGGMGVVYQARHVERGNRVALKFLPNVDGERLHKFKREFRSLADVSHPHLIGLHRLESDGNIWFFTMDLVEDPQDFLSYVRPRDELDEARLRDALSQLVAGVSALHRLNIIHRDLKPSNVLVDQQGKVVLLDFGLVAEVEHRHFTVSVDRIVGTPAYMAPEQASGEEVTSASDWYAVGVMLYEALTGRRPFEGRMLEILQDKRERDAPPLPDDPTIPKDLVRLCTSLLARDPDQRHVVDQFAELFDHAVATAPQFATPAGELVLVGRDRQMVELNDAYRRFEKNQQPLTIFISGRSGEGKSVLAEQFLLPMRVNRKLAFISGRCYDRESVPFKALDSVIDGLCGYLRSLSERDAALLIPRDIALLARLFPVLKRANVVATAPKPRMGQLDDRQVRARAFAALREILVRISDRSPIVAFIDDLQWGDADSARVLFEAVRPPDAPWIMFLGTYRSDEAAESPFLKQWHELSTQADAEVARLDVRVGPLSEDQCVELFVKFFGEGNETLRAIARRLAAETGGNPFLLSELIEGFDPRAQSLQPIPMHEVIARKLRHLPTEASRWLRFVAVSGGAISARELSQASGFDDVDVSTITAMRNQKLIRLIGSDDEPQLDTYHDKVRENVLEQMSPSDRVAYHRSLADTIAESAGPLPGDFFSELEEGSIPEIPSLTDSGRVFDLSYHYDAADEQEKALAYSILAADQSTKQFSPEVAAQQFAIAYRRSDAANDRTKLLVMEGYGKALMLLGEYERAKSVLQHAKDLPASTEQQIRVDDLLGQIAFRQGQFNVAQRLFETSMRQLGFWIPRTRIGLAVAVLREITVQFLHTISPWSVLRGTSNLKFMMAPEAMYCWQQCYTFRNTPRLFWATLVNLNHAERLAASRALASTYAFHAMVLQLIGWPGTRGDRYLTKAMRIAEDEDNIYLKGVAESCFGVALHASAQYERGIDISQDAVEDLTRVGDLFESNLARFHKAYSHFGLGQLDEAVAEAWETFESSARISDSRTMCSSWLLARATDGNIPFDEMKKRIPHRPEDIMSTTHALLAEGMWHSFHHRPEECLAICQRAASLVRKSGCVNSHTILVIPMLARAYRLCAARLETTDPPRCSQLLKRSLRTAKWGTRITRFIPAAYPVSLRERALTLQAIGKTKQALKFAAKSCRVAEKQNAKYEYAQSALLRAQLRQELGFDNAEQEFETAEANLAAFHNMIEQASSDSEGRETT